MSKLKNDYICGTCKRYEDCFYASGGIDQIGEDDTCEDWEGDDEPTEEELEAQAVDVAERKTHRKEVEGEDLV